MRMQSNAFKAEMFCCRGAVFIRSMKPKHIGSKTLRTELEKKNSNILALKGKLHALNYLNLNQVVVVHRR